MTITWSKFVCREAALPLYDNQAEVVADYAIIGGFPERQCRQATRRSIGPDNALTNDAIAIRRSD